MDNPGNNQHFNVLIWVGGRGGLRISTLCTIGKMLTIVNDPILPMDQQLKQASQTFTTGTTTSLQTTKLTKKRKHTEHLLVQNKPIFVHMPDYTIQNFQDGDLSKPVPGVTGQE